MIEVREGKRGSTYSALKKMSLHCDQIKKPEFVLPEHQVGNLSPLQCAEKIAEYFVQISREYQPISVESLPQSIQEYLNDSSRDIIPVLSEYQVYQKIKHSKKPNSSVGRDIPIKIVKNFDVELSGPISKIFNKISRTQIYPDHWKMENGIPLAKVYPPESESDLRIISKTPYISKLYEGFLCDWLMEVINPYLDPDQYGLKGLSITHYLIKYINFIQTSLDSLSPTAVVATCIDLSKAFNRVDHGILIEDLYAMKCPAFLLKIFISFLSKRTLILKYKGNITSPKELNGGTPAGTLLGVIFFIIKFNGALLRPSVERNSLLINSEYKKAKYMMICQLLVGLT